MKRRERGFTAAEGCYSRSSFLAACDRSVSPDPDTRDLGKAGEAETERPRNAGPFESPAIGPDQALRFMRLPSNPRPLSSSHAAAGSGTGAGAKEVEPGLASSKLSPEPAVER